MEGSKINAHELENSHFISVLKELQTELILALWKKGRLSATCRPGTTLSECKHLHTLSIAVTPLQSVYEKKPTKPHILPVTIHRTAGLVVRSNPCLCTLPSGD